MDFTKVDASKKDVIDQLKKKIQGSKSLGPDGADKRIL